MVVLGLLAWTVSLPAKVAALTECPSPFQRSTFCQQICWANSTFYWGTMCLNDGTGCFICECYDYSQYTVCPPAE